MTKYSSILKLKVVSDYLNGDLTFEQLSLKYNIPSTTPIKHWVKLVQSLGMTAVTTSHTKEVYTQDFKIAVVNHVQTHQVSQSQAAVHFNISPSQVKSWVSIVSTQGIVGLRTKVKGNPRTMAEHVKIKPMKQL
ncbi:helix-turn-helix domain-containing protein [Weissella coleopterorum]|uniref:helix-turn-helix domain-containing protein n=1 Tax=Weissella coleopterorum TaxID=2714949 RepID=UPI001FE81113|nr:transposase [Weissella coleopterorum]